MYRILASATVAALALAPVAAQAAQVTNIYVDGRQVAAEVIRAGAGREITLTINGYKVKVMLFAGICTRGTSPADVYVQGAHLGKVILVPCD